MSAAEQPGDVLAELREAVAEPDAEKRYGKTLASVRNLLLFGRDDDVTIGHARRVACPRGLRAAEFDGLVKEHKRMLADPVTVLYPRGHAPAPVTPGYPIRMSARQGRWEYSLGSEDFSRGVWQWQEAADDWVKLGGLPHVHARIVHRDGGGDRNGTSGLLSATEDGPPHVIDLREVGDGSWAPKLGMTLSGDRTVQAAVATALSELIYALPAEAEHEAVPTMQPDGRVGVPVRECLPGGYGECSDVMDRPAALGQWAELAAEVAVMPEAAAVLSLSASAWAVRPLGLQAFWFELWGDPGQGKTTALRLAAGVWGDPSELGGVVQPWQLSPVGLGRHLGALGCLPGFFDEAGVANFAPTDWARRIFETTSGNQRLTGERIGHGARRSPPWASVLFSTGNGRIAAGLAAGRHAGLARRVVSVSAPFTESAAHADRLAALLGGCYGHLGAELLERFCLADARGYMLEAAELLPLPAEGIARSLTTYWHVALIGARMLDDALGLADVMSTSVMALAACWLAEHGRAPEHDADRVIAEVRDAMVREPARWPTVSEYRETRRAAAEWSGADPEREAVLPRHGIDRRVAGVRADDDSWVGVLKGAWHGEICEPLGVDEVTALTELYARRVLILPERSRKRGDWQTVVKLDKSARVYKLALPPLEAEAEPAEPPEPASEPPSEPASEPHSESLACNTFEADRPVTSVTEQVRGRIGVRNSPVTASVTASVTAPAEGLESPAEPVVPWLAEAREYLAYCRANVASLNPRYHPTPEGAAKMITHRTPEDAAAIAAAYALALAEAEAPAAAEQLAESVPAAAQIRPPRTHFEPRGPAFAVLSLEGRAYLPEGEVLELPAGWLERIGHVGDVAALGLGLGARVLWIPSEVRERLGLPAELPALGKREGYPHQFTESADPAAWDVWPAEPAGLAGWLTVYRMPSTLREGLALAFAEWLAPVGDGPQFAELPPVALAEALTLIWQATTYAGKDGRYGGAHYSRSPGATMRRVLGAAARRRRSGLLEALAELPPVYGRAEGLALARVPGLHMAPAAHVPAGWLLAELDVRSCFLSAAIGTDFGVGEAEHRTRPVLAEVLRMPGAHLVSAPSATSAIHPALWPMLPAPRRGRAEVSAWVDTIAARWLADCSVPFTVAESWVWPERQGRRVFDSVAQRLGEARDALGGRQDAPARIASAVVKAMYARTFGGLLASDFGGERDPDDPWHRPDWWLTERVQAEVRKQRNLRPGLEAGAVLVLGQADIDSVFIAAPSLEALEDMPGTGGRPAIAEGRGKFAIKSSAVVTPALAELLGSGRARPLARKDAIRAALADVNGGPTDGP